MLDIDKNNKITAILATENPDRHGDKIKITGLDFSNYLKNPIVLWAHDITKPPIAKLKNLHMKEKKVLADIYFAKHSFAEELLALYQSGFLNAWSIGFIIKEYQEIEYEQKENKTKSEIEKIITRKNLASCNKDSEKGKYIKKAEVVEVSAVPIPANPEAVTIKTYNKKEKYYIKFSEKQFKELIKK